jgi:hypothetical protein
MPPAFATFNIIPFMFPAVNPAANNSAAVYKI